MTVPLGLAVLWAVLVNILAAAQGKDEPRRIAFGLVALGIPIVGLITWQHGPWLGLLSMAVGIVVLRWPMVTLGRRTRSKALR